MSNDRFTLRVAVHTILIKDNQILLIRRFNTGWRDGHYGLPAGHCDGQETILEAAIREAKEEVGLNLKPEDMEIAHIVHQIKKVEYIDFYFLARKWQGEPKICEPDKCDEIGWFALDNLPDNLIIQVQEAIGNFQKGLLYSEFREL